jgi:hypothetical protein
MRCWVATLTYISEQEQIEYYNPDNKDRYICGEDMPSDTVYVRVYDFDLIPRRERVIIDFIKDQFETGISDQYRDYLLMEAEVVIKETTIIHQ